MKTALKINPYQHGKELLYMVRTRLELTLKADFHGTILSRAICLRHFYNTNRVVQIKPTKNLRKMW